MVAASSPLKDRYDLSKLGGRYSFTRNRQPVRVALAMTSFYTPQMWRRAPLCLDMIRLAQIAGLPTVLVDGGTNIEFPYEGSQVNFRMYAEALRAHVLPEVHHVPGQLGPGRRQAIAEAARLVGPEGIVIWIKEQPNVLLGLRWAIQRVASGEADIVIPDRGAGLGTCPDFQATSEAELNRVWNGLFGFGAAMIDGRPLLDTSNGPLDFLSGVRVIAASAVGPWVDYDGRYGDGGEATLCPVITAAALGARVQGMPLGFPYIHEQPWEKGDPAKMEKVAQQYASLGLAGHRQARDLGLIA